MASTWIAKPFSALTANELQAWAGMRNASLRAPSQTLAWAEASLTLGAGCHVIFSPESEISAVFILGEGHAECVNGPVFDWNALRSAEEQNELIGMCVHALLKSAPKTTSVSLRPRLEENELNLFEKRSAFPFDSVDRSATLEFDLQVESERRLLQSLGQRIRHEINRSLRAGSQTTIIDPVSGIVDFWGKVMPFYRSRGLWIPDLTWAQAMCRGPDVAIRIYRTVHPASGAEDQALVLKSGNRAYNLFSCSTRGEANLNLNALTQWTALRDQRASGVLKYDLNGILHPSASESGSFRGVDLHKRKFKGIEVRHSNPLIRFGDPV
jgi:hypothetical protein